MDGKLLNKSVKYALEWADRYVTVDLANSLHIDHINPIFRIKKLWIPCSLAIYNAMLAYRDQYDIMLCFYLKDPRRAGPKPLKLEQSILSENTPPAIYLSKWSNDEFKQTIANLPLMANISEQLEAPTYYQETFVQEDDITYYNRALFVYK